LKTIAFAWALVAAHVAMADPIDPRSLYPLVVPVGYVLPGNVHRPLLSGVEVTLVVDLHGFVRGVRAVDLADTKLSEEQAYRVALGNLEAAAKRNEIHANLLGGKNGAPRFVMFSDHWLAATCVLLGGAAKMARDALGTDQLIAMIPHRDVLIVFADGDVGSREKGRRFFLDKESDGRKPITDRLLRLLPPSDKPFYERSPVVLVDGGSR
jgi:hypothetical protein